MYNFTVAAVPVNEFMFQFELTAIYDSLQMKNCDG